MSALVGYGSSDEEEDVQSEKASKISKTDATARPNSGQVSRPSSPRSGNEEADLQQPRPQINAQAQYLEPARGPESVLGPISGPTVPSQATDSDSTPPSPYTFERERVRELTMPTIPNFDIPDSPPPPVMNSEEAAVLAISTKKFERFLELKKQGVHFNDRLGKYPGMRNPSFLSNLMNAVGVSQDDSYASALPPELAVRTQWPIEYHADGLVRQNEKREKRRLAGRDKVDFVSARGTDR